MVTPEGLVDWRGSSSHPDITTFTTARTRDTTGREHGESVHVPGWLFGTHVDLDRVEPNFSFGLGTKENPVRLPLGV
jgi:hypothetical protein